MRLICQTCAKPYDVAHGRRRWSSCSKCRHKTWRKAALKREARRKQLGGPPAVVPPAAMDGRPDLDALMRELDAVSDRALKAALAVLDKP
jgi:hypothetical protein